jgi:high-affinity iron transporter
MSTLTAHTSRGRRWLGALAAVGLLAIVAIVAAALAPSGSHKQPFSELVVQPHAGGKDQLKVHLTKVFGTNVPAARYGTEIALLEDRGVDLQGRMVSDLSPLAPSQFTAPEDHYRTYAQGWTLHAISNVAVLRRAIAAGNRAAARRDWVTAWSDYLHLGAVYGLFRDLDQAIDGRAGALPGGTSDPRFSGFHRLEMGLWSGAPLRSLLPWVDRLTKSLSQLHGVIAQVPIAPLDYATRSHEILEDAQRDFLSGVDVPWSQEGVVATAAGLAATDEVVATLTTLLTGRDNTLTDVRFGLARLGKAIHKIRADHHGVLPTLTQLTPDEQALLNGTLAGTLSALSDLPGTLETTGLPNIPKLPSGAGR